jgi:orotidine-5'-phosphate decarboxylase
VHWGDNISEKVAKFGPLVVGIDPIPGSAPSVLSAGPISFPERYTSALLEGADGRAGIVKFQSAYFEAFGSDGIAALARGIAMAREREFAVILDVKRGDIGSTSEAYARAYLTPKSAGGTDLEVDCMTVNPFLGPDTLAPFVGCARRYGKGVFVLVKTSNEGSGWLQDQMIDGSSVSDRVARLVARWANETLGSHGIGAVGAVVGATYPNEGVHLRELMPNAIILAPGLGAQGADPRALSAMATPTGPLLISASRGIGAVNDPGLALEDYIETVKTRIDAFKREISGLT